MGLLLGNQEVICDQKTNVKDEIDERVGVDKDEDSIHSSCASSQDLQVEESWDEEGMARVKKGDQQGRNQT